MPRNIDYYFSLHSPWAYIGHVPFMELVRRYDAKVTFKPISLANVFAENRWSAGRQTAPGAATLSHP